MASNAAVSSSVIMVVILLFKIIDHRHTSGHSSNLEEYDDDDDCDESVQLQHAARSTQQAFLVSSLSSLPAFLIGAINLGEAKVAGDERVQLENLDHEKSVDRFSGSVSDGQSLNERATEEPTKRRP